MTTTSTTLPKKESITNKYFMALLIIFVVPLSGLSTDIFVPGLPDIKNFFDVSDSSVQLSITSYIFGLGLMQLIAGSISDSFGRKKPFSLATTTYLLVSFLIPHASSIEQVTGLRFLQGAMTAMMIVPMRSVISDLFSGKEFQKIMTYVAFSWTLGPVIAPFIGGYLVHYFGWQASFYFLFCYTLIVFTLIMINIPETTQNYHKFNVKSIVGQYTSILTNRDFTVSAVTNGLLYSIIILFISTSPFLLKNNLHFSSVEYGYLALALGASLSIGSLGNRYLMKYSLELRLKVGLAILTIVSLSFLIFGALFPLSTYLIMIPISIIYMVIGMLLTSNMTFALSLFPQMAGVSNGLFSAFIFIFTSFVSIISVYFESNGLLPLSLSIFILSLLIVSIQRLKIT
ncbi:multidrug effflux MFS transporter [Vibrio profundum]|uniref:multidrug effflux MFS transporter n=1 Tax=Vibrio profundum TaxID=2910247 RepID=UPI003D1264C1